MATFDLRFLPAAVDVLPANNKELTPERTRGEGVDAHLKVFLSFLLEDKTSALDVFSNCSFIPRAHFESSSVMVSFYGYEV